MAVAAVPGVRRSLVGSVIDAVRSPRGRRAAARLAVLAREHAVTVISFAAIDAGSFRAAAAAGWIVSGVLALVLDWQIRG